jgi:hypothetical protein
LDIDRLYGLMHHPSGPAKSRRKKFRRYFFIHCYTIYALLPNKQEKTYSRLLEILKTDVQNEPVYIGLDFEQAIINSIRFILPDKTIHACYFHFRQNLWRQIQAFGFAKE